MTIAVGGTFNTNTVIRVNTVCYFVLKQRDVAIMDSFIKQLLQCTYKHVCNVYSQPFISVVS